MKDNVILYGAKSMNIDRAYDYLKCMGKKVVAVADRNPELRGKEFFGLVCLMPEEMKNIDATVVITNGLSVRQIAESLDRIGIEWITIGQLVLEREKEKIEEIKGLLNDELSRDTIDAIISAHKTLDFSSIAHIMRPISGQYFDFFNEEIVQSVYVDVGAYVGDTIEKYLWHNITAKMIYAFEIMPNTHKALSARCDRLSLEWRIPRENIKCENLGLSDSMEFNDTFQNNEPTGARLAKASLGGVAVTTLDTYLSGSKVDFIKADIEGSETKMLYGAAETIKKWKPRLAICIYHTVWDLFEIPLYIKRLVPEYKIAVRQYSSTLTDTVMYAWVETL